MVFLGISYLVCEHKNKDSDQVAIVADDGERSVVTWICIKGKGAPNPIFKETMHFLKS